MANEKTKLIKWLTALNDPELTPVIEKLSNKSVHIPSTLKAAVLAALITNTSLNAAYPAKNLKKTVNLFKSLMPINASVAEQEKFFYDIVQQNPVDLMKEPMRKVNQTALSQESENTLHKTRGK